MSVRAAFTLIEMLIAVAVLSVLMAMLMPMVTLAKRQSERTATSAVMFKVDAAARLFRNEIGGYPWQPSYADIDAGEPWSNRLAYQLGQDIDPLADLPKVRQDADDAAAKYAYECTLTTDASGNPIANEPATMTVFTYRKADIMRTWSGSGPWTDISDNKNTSNGLYNPNERAAKAAVLNRMAAELARIEVHAGNVALTGRHLADICNPGGTLIVAGRDTSATRLLPTPASAGRPGWAMDYLLGEVEKRYRNGEAVLDAWGMPLILVSQVHEGGRFARTYLFSSVVYRLDLRPYQLDRHGRRTLSATDPASGVATVADPPALPDPANLRHSDRRTWAAPGYEIDLEVWSAGPDRSFAWMRDDQRNRDNVPLVPYDRRLP